MFVSLCFVQFNPFPSFHVMRIGNDLPAQLCISKNEDSTDCHAQN